jgi:hypothetical protein
VEWTRKFLPGIGFRTALVAVQIAMSLLLLAGATLFVRTLSKLQSVNLGIQSGKSAAVHAECETGRVQGPGADPVLRHGDGAHALHS